MPIAMGTGTLPGTATDYSPIYGGKPVVPSPVATAGQTIAGNVSNLGQLYNLGGGVNRFNEGQLLGELQTALPGYSQNVAQSSANIGNLLGGVIPPDVLNQMAIQGAERGVAIGSPGSPNANAAYLAALGQTSLGLQSQGEQELTGAIARTPKAPLFDLASQFVTPDQQQQAAMAANIYASAPVPAEAAAERLRLAELGLGNQPRTGSLLGVDRGQGGPPETPLTPYDQGGVVGPYGALGPFEQPTPNLPYNVTGNTYGGYEEGSAYATLPNAPNAQWNPDLGIFIDPTTGLAYDKDGTPVGPAAGAQPDQSFYSDIGPEAYASDVAPASD